MGEAYIHACMQINGANSIHSDVSYFVTHARTATARCLRLLLSLLGAAEDLGMSLSSTSHIQFGRGKNRCVPAAAPEPLCTCATRRFGTCPARLCKRM